MKQLLILSGKGGTGKTTVASSFVKLAQARAFADCDVDAPNLHLLLAGEQEPLHTDYYGLPKALINTEKCVACGTCLQNCRFNAVNFLDGRYEIDQFACEGCGLCKELCSVDAIEMLPAVAGDLMLYKNEDHAFSTACLKMGSGTSGKLVTEVKQQMFNAAEQNAELAIIDGSPGIGCPVIASISGVDLLLIVTEPSLSGLSDLTRILQTARQFETKAVVCINKYDLNLHNTERIEEFCQDLQVPCIAKIPFDKQAGKAINEGLSVVDVSCPAGQAIKQLFVKVMDLPEVSG